MRKKNFVLLAISIIVGLVALIVPFIGIGDGVEIVTLPVTTLLSSILSLIAFNNLYKETNNSYFHTAKVHSICSICAILIITIISPIICGGQYIGIIEFFAKVVEASDNDNLILSLYSNFLMSYVSLFLINFVGRLFYSFSIISFIKGMKTEKVNLTHLNKMKSSLTTFCTINWIIMGITTLMLFLAAKAFSEELINQTDEFAKYFIILYLLMIFVCLPALVALTPAYTINTVKSIFYLFRTSVQIEQPDVYEQQNY